MNAAYEPCVHSSPVHQSAYAVPLKWAFVPGHRLVDPAERLAQQGIRARSVDHARRRERLRAGASARVHGQQARRAGRHRRALPRVERRRRELQTAAPLPVRRLEVLEVSVVLDQHLAVGPHAQLVDGGRRCAPKPASAKSTARSVMNGSVRITKSKTCGFETPRTKLVASVVSEANRLERRLGHERARGEPLRDAVGDLVVAAAHVPPLVATGVGDEEVVEPVDRRQLVHVQAVPAAHALVQPVADRRPRDARHVRSSQSSMLSRSICFGLGGRGPVGVGHVARLVRRPG